MSSINAPCQKCGCEDQVVRDTGGGHYQVFCKVCDSLLGED